MKLSSIIEGQIKDDLLQHIHVTPEIRSLANYADPTDGKYVDWILYNMSQGYITLPKDLDGVRDFIQGWDHTGSDMESLWYITQLASWKDDSEYWKRRGIIKDSVDTDTIISSR